MDPDPNKNCKDPNPDLGNCHGSGSRQKRIQYQEEYVGIIEYPFPAVAGWPHYNIFVLPQVQVQLFLLGYIHSILLNRNISSTKFLPYTLSIRRRDLKKGGVLVSLRENSFI